MHVATIKKKKTLMPVQCVGSEIYVYETVAWKIRNIKFKIQGFGDLSIPHQSHSLCRLGTMLPLLSIFFMIERKVSMYHCFLA